MFVLDTDLLSLLEWQGGSPSDKLRARLSACTEAEVATTIVNYEEQVRGWLARLARASTLAERVDIYQRLHHNLNDYLRRPILDFDPAAAAQFESLTTLRLHIGMQDLKIAAICLAHNATLLTRNLRDFKKVPGLKAEDWTM